jgi:hypothetical protein
MDSRPASLPIGAGLFFRSVVSWQSRSLGVRQKKKGTHNCVPFSPLLPDSECEPQCELHESRRGQHGVIFPELRRIERERRLRHGHRTWYSPASLLVLLRCRGIMSEESSKLHAENARGTEYWLLNFDFTAKPQTPPASPPSSPHAS